MPFDDYSDSDDSTVEDVQTSVLLGLPDGPITFPSDLTQPRISRLGGLPVFPRGIPSPPVRVATCDSCEQPMELLVQLWCPLEASPYDRTLHVWGCSRTRCQRKEGTVKAVRAFRYNAKYAAKLEARRAKLLAKEQTGSLSSGTMKKAASNPFTISESSNLGPQLFGGGFGEEAANEFEIDDSKEDDIDSGDPSSASEDDDQASKSVQIVTDILKNTTLATSSADEWATFPTHPVLYLDTTSEYIAPPTKASSKAEAQVQENKEGQWGIEGYERMKGIDEVFEKFVLRVENEPEQCIRYELSGTPLPFSTETVYKRLFPLASSIPLAPGAATVISGTGSVSSESTQSSTKRVYDPKAIPPCEACGSPRVFECQLMPNLINVFRASSATKTKSKQTDDERKAEVARILSGGEDGKQGGDVNIDRSGNAKGDMEWGTCMVFSCAKDCCRAKNGEGQEWRDTDAGWKEEVVFVQWEV